MLTENEKALGRALLGHVQAAEVRQGRLAANAAVNVANLRAKVLELEAACAQQRKAATTLEQLVAELAQRVKVLEAGREG